MRLPNPAQHPGRAGGRGDSRQEPKNDIDALIQEQVNGKFAVPGDQSIVEVDEFGFKTFTGDVSLSSEEILEGVYLPPD